MTGGDLFQFEREHYARGLVRLAGVDEVGRGPLAGPVVAAAVVLPRAWCVFGLPRPMSGLIDSKQVKAFKREAWFEMITGDSEIDFGVGIVEATEVDRINILQATYRAMREALAVLSPSVDHVLVDGRLVPALGTQQTALVKGDCRSYSIAAASILAKVTRDRLMMDFHEYWPEYCFSTNKGYGTVAHLAAIEEHGPCPIHRRSFAPLRDAEPELF